MSFKLVVNPKANRAQAVFERRAYKHFGVMFQKMAISCEDNHRYANAEVQALWERFKAGDL